MSEQRKYTDFENQPNEETPELSEEALGNVAGGAFDPRVLKNIAKDAYQGRKSGNFSMNQSLGTHLPNSKFTAATQEAIQGVYQHGKHIAQSVKGKFRSSGSTAV
jgi:hypothetical protein